jgi:signal transduction histidine kinase
MMTTERPTAVARLESRLDREAQPHRLVSAWNGILHEFRNHLTVVLAAATEIRVALPPDAGRETAEALAETEWNVQRMNALVGFLDAALRDGAPVVADLEDVIERALRLAAPAMGRTAVTIHKDRRVGVPNRGASLEALMASLLIDLVRTERRTRTDDRRLQIDLRVVSTRTTLELVVESSGHQPPLDSWRLSLAADLAARLGASIEPLDDLVGYRVRFS